MPVDYSIAMGFQAPKFDYPMNALAQVLQVQAAQGQNALSQYTLKKAQRSDEETNGLAALFKTPGFDLSNPEHQAQAYQVAPTVASTFIKGQLDNKKLQSETTKNDATTQKTQLEAAHQKLSMAGQILATVKDQASYDTARQTATAQGLDVSKMPPQYDPAFVQQKIDEGVDLKTRLEQKWKQMEYTTPNANTVANNQTSLATNAATNATHVQTTGMTNATSRANNAATIAKDYNVAGMNSDGTQKQMPLAGDGTIDLSKILPEDLAAAHRYRADGTLPPNMGRGAQGAAESKRIRAIATSLDAQAGESPEDARIRQLALKGDVGAISAMRKREVQVAANVKNFDFNADQVVQLSSKVDRTGVPLVNAWINAGRRSVTGNPDLSAFDVAVKTTVNEFAQIVGGTTSGASTEGEKKKAEALLNAQQTPEQVLSVINQMRIESKNRMESFASTRKGMMPTKSGASPAAATAPAAAPSGWTYVGPVK